MKRYYGFWFLFLLISGTWSCRQNYTPPAIKAVNSYLVADGFLNAGSDSTIILLSRTRGLTAPSTPILETNAQVFVEGDGGFAAQLAYLGSGRYGSPGLNLDIVQKYRVRIQTANGSEYLSDFTPVKPSPPIDSISWQKSDTGITVFVNTHDPSKNSTYYRWEYAETWEYHSFYESFAHYNPVDTSVITNAIEVPHICWDNDHSDNILIATSANLSSDIIYLKPLTVIPPNSEKFSVKYSIIVKQYAITSDAYNYWETLRKTTEEAGTLFDQEPSQITGNIHCVNNPKEPVIGYIGAGIVAQQRIFVSNSQVAPWQTNEPCGTIALHSKDSLAYYENTGGWDILYTLPPGRYQISAYILSSDFCVDCTARRGSDVKPAFWQ